MTRTAYHGQFVLSFPGVGILALRRHAGSLGTQLSVLRILHTRFVMAGRPEAAPKR